MPEIARFYGIVIKMFFDEHNPPHFHATYGEYDVLIDINTLAVFAGHLPPRALGLVIEWATINQNKLINNWKRAKDLKSLNKIEPLK